MKQSPLITALLVAVCGMALVTLVLAGGYEYHYRQLRRLQPQVAGAQNDQTLFRALASDCLEYSKHNPAIDPILQPLGVKPPNPAAPTTTKSTRK